MDQYSPDISGKVPSYLVSNGLDNLEEVTPGIGKKGDAETHCGYIVWLASDGHVTALQFIDDGVHALDAETGMMPSRHVVAAMQIFIGGAFCCARAGHQLEMKTVVAGRIKEGKSESGYRRRFLRPKVELVCIPGNGQIEVRHTNGCVVDLQRSKRAGGR